MIAKLIGVRPGEGNIVFRLGGHAFLILAATTIYYTAAEALFLSHFDAELLPLPFLSGAILSLLLSVAYEKLQRKWRAGRLSLILVLFLASFLSLLLFLVKGGIPGGPFLLLAAAPMSGVLLRVENLGFFSRSLDTRAQKRLFATVGILGGLGAVCGGLVAAGLSWRVHVEHLPWISVGLILFSSLLLQGATARLRPRTSPHAAPWGEVVRHRFALLLCLLILLMSILSTVIRYQLGASLKESELSPDGMASYLGMLNAGINLCAVLFQLFLARSIIHRFGVGSSLALYPLVLLIAGVAGIFLGGLLVASGTLFLERLLRQNLQRPVANVALMPMPDFIRSRAALVVRGALGPVAIALASFGILISSSSVSWSQLSIGVAILAGVSFFLAMWVRKEYVAEVTSALQSRRLRTHGASGGPSLMDASVRELLAEQVASTSPEKTVLALRLLVGEVTPKIVRTIQERWPRWEAWRREEAVRAMGVDPHPDSIRFLTELSPTEAERVLAARLECAEVPVSPQLLHSWIQTSGAALRSAALVRLFHEKGTEAIASSLEEWIHSEDPTLSEAAVRVIGETEDKRFWEELPRLAQTVPVAVAEVLSKNPDSSFSSLCIQFLIDERTYLPAREALIGMGKDAVDPLVQAIDLPLVMGRAIQVLGQVRERNARVALVQLLTHSDDEVRSHAARALSGVRGLRMAPILEAIENEFHHAKQLRKEAVESEGVLHSEAEGEFNRAVERILILFSLLYPKRPFRRILLSWISSDKVQRGFALEALEANLDSHWRERLLPVLDGSETGSVEKREADPWRDRLRKALAKPGTDLIIDEALRLKKSTLFERWRMRDLEALVLRMRESSPPISGGRIILVEGRPVHLASGILGHEEAAPSVEGAIVLSLPLLYQMMERRPRCAKLWLRTLSSKLLSRVSDQESYTMGDISFASRQPLEGEEGDRDLSLWERMFFLGSVPLFRGMSAERLKLVAEISRSLTVPSGSRIVKEGTPGHHYYVVCSGTVEVAVEGQQVSVLGGGEGFGEAALLSGELRQATVRALSRCDLLSIDQVDFLDLIHVHPSLVRSFTPMIAERSLQLP